MKFAKLACISAIALFTVLAIPPQLVAQDKQEHYHKHHHYQIVDMGTFGGPQSYNFLSSNSISSPVVLNNHGTLAGFADTSTPDPFPNFCFNPDCYVSHAFRWRKGIRTDLGALARGFSSASTSISANGVIAGFSQNGEIDPLFPGFPEARGVVWNDGKIANLGTLEGGYESVANAINSHGQVVGGATNTIPDSTSISLSATSGQFFPTIPFQARAFLWQAGVMQDLGTLGGNDAQAVLINESGQVVGWSYTSTVPSPACAADWVGVFLLTTGSFLWDKENGMVDLGSFGGTCTVANGLNQKGQVVGTSLMTGDQFGHAFLWDRATGLTDLGTLGGHQAQATAINDHGEAVGGSYLPGDVQFDAVLWRKGVITDLGALDGDSFAFAFWINLQGQIVGSGSASGFLWEDGGPMVDLNTLVSSSSRLHITQADDINDRGEIAGVGALSNGNEHAVLLIPCDENHSDVEGCDYSLVDAATAPRLTGGAPQYSTSSIRPSIRKRAAKP